MINVIINGSNGKMGIEAVKAVTKAPNMQVVAALDKGDNLAASITQHKADIVVDLTHPSAVKQNVTIILTNNAHAVVGTTGLSETDLNDIKTLAKKHHKAAIVCPNFAIGAILMMQLAAQAAKHLPEVEIIEYHHNQKADAPSGTAIKSAEVIAAANPNVNSRPIDEKELIPGSRGAICKNIPIHAVRLPGQVADQDILLGGLGQTLKLSHRTISREAFMPGIILCINKASSLNAGLTYGLENLL